MDQICRLENTIQEYAWGSKTMIPELVGAVSPSRVPQAELWMGAHPKAPSRALFNDRWVPLDQLIAQYPDDILGRRAAKRYAGKLPYLFKVLAAEEPLSIQAHPSREQAVAGFERENRAGIPLDAGNRNYRDDNHKPECICALTRYWAMCGFRSRSEIRELFSPLQVPELGPAIQALGRQAEGDRLKSFFQKLITLPPSDRENGLRSVVAAAERHRSENIAFHWIVRLHETYGYDIGILSPLYLNLVCLEPGQALFLFSGELHAYLSGLGIELMANSDNVLRGGLTPKHVDIPELIHVLRFAEKIPQILLPAETESGECFYQTPADEFVLSVISLKKGQRYQSMRERSVEIMICTQGAVSLINGKDNRRITLEKGQSVMIPARLPAYQMEGAGMVYKAGVPLNGDISPA